MPINDHCWSATLKVFRDEMTINVDNYQKWHGRRILHQNTINTFLSRSRPFLWYSYHQNVQKIYRETGNSPKQIKGKHHLEYLWTWNGKPNYTQWSRGFLCNFLQGWNKILLIQQQQKRKQRLRSL